MKLIKSVMIVVLMMVLIACGGKNETQSQGQSSISETTHKMEGHESIKMEKQKTHISESGQLVYYTCPMESHKHVHSDEPGNCPECGMKMVAAVVTTEKSAEYFGCPMKSHSHIRSVKPSTCDQCGMKLVPIRLKKPE